MSLRDYPWKLAGQKSEWCFSNQRSVTEGCIKCGATPCTKYFRPRCVKHYQRKMLTRIPEWPACRMYFCRCEKCQAEAPEEETIAQQLQLVAPGPTISQGVGTASAYRVARGRLQGELMCLRQMVVDIQTQVTETEEVLDNLATPRNSELEFLLKLESLWERKLDMG